ncbi:AfsR/SARP family transcriptional regulator [Micromonospora sp. CB01531]|uniref:AfsR/SARP family transcriptional regulator n=1 Tax=Micromonospora sp. CB01531 TaxID=1718947 RepID=UPI0009390297|nr:AfsR/SARP family transcriptional regulator [Micromonospora sp. CB01531]OKI48954.1 hypothetical protein A6A27_36105 [Micromonospora sp. CB01531]
MRNLTGRPTRITCLGQWSIESGGRHEVVRPSRRAQLFALLLINADRIVPTRELIAEVWPEDASGDLVNDLYAHVTRLRADLQRWGGGSGLRLATCRPGYRLELGAAELDLNRFRDLAAQAAQLREHAPHASLSTARRALAIWPGTPFPGVELGPAASIAKVRLEEEHLNLMIGTFDLALDLGQDAMLIPDLEELTYRYPYCERFYDQLMVAHYRAGRPDGVMRTYHRLVQVLADDLGLTPSPALQRRYVAILRHEDSMEVGHRSVATVPA